MNSLLNAAWQAECDEPSDKLVLIYLSDRADAKGKAWPHVTTIAKQTGLSRGIVLNALQRIEARRHISVSRRNGCSNSYLVDPDTSPTVEPDQSNPCTDNRTLREPPGNRRPQNSSQ
jgi:hypothetical protein